MKIRMWMLVVTVFGGAMLSGRFAQADDLAIQSFDSMGRLTFNTLNDGTNYNYRVEWAPSVAGPWSSFTGAGTWLDVIQAVQGSVVTGMVPMCYRVVATRGLYMVADLSGGMNAVSYPVTYYRTLDDVPGGAGSEAYKTTSLLLRLIPRGVFTMGSPTNELGRFTNETPHQVTLTQDFYIGVFPVTQRQWERVMGTWPSWYNNTSYRDTRPVEQVNYDAIRGRNAGAGWPANGNLDADSFMGRLRARTGKAFDLPTESQWEYAGRAGTTTALNSGYNLTNTLSDSHFSEVGRYAYNGGSVILPHNVDTTLGTAKVGSYLPNAWGLYDIHGNVWEWCLDWHGTYPGTATDPGGATTGLYRVARGGLCYWQASWCRAAARSGAEPSVADPQGLGGVRSMGFRVALPSGQ